MIVFGDIMQDLHFLWAFNGIVLFKVVEVCVNKDMFKLH